jgi:hypothetical protein
LVEKNTVDTKTIFNSKAIIATTNIDGQNYTLAHALTSNMYLVLINNGLYTTGDNAFPFTITGLTLKFTSALPPDLANTQIFILCV